MPALKTPFTGPGGVLPVSSAAEKPLVGNASTGWKESAFKLPAAALTAGQFLQDPAGDGVLVGAAADSPLSTINSVTQTTTTLTASHKTVVLNGTASHTITLPAVAGADRVLRFIKRSTLANGVVTLDGDGAETIVRDGVGATTLLLVLPGEWVDLWDDGTSWIVLGTNVPRIGEWQLIEIKKGPGTPATSFDCDSSFSAHDGVIWDGWRVSYHLQAQFAGVILYSFALNSISPTTTDGSVTGTFGATPTELNDSADSGAHVNLNNGEVVVGWYEIPQSGSSVARMVLHRYADNRSPSNFIKAMPLITPAAGTALNKFGWIAANTGLGASTTMRIYGRRLV